MDISSTCSGEITIITIDRPEVRNAVDRPTADALAAAFRAFEGDDSQRVAILTGANGVFCAGADLQAMGSDRANRVAADMAVDGPMGPSRMSLTKPVIAAVAGYCLGGGCEIVLACDLRVAADNLRIGLPEVNIGIIPGGGGNIRLVRTVGKARAKELIFTGDFISAEEALRIGLVNRVVPKDTLLQETRSLAKRCIRHSRHSLAMAKVAINIGAEIDLESAHTLEALAFCMMFSTSDQKEGMRAFLEKRKPVYEGRKED